MNRDKAGNRQSTKLTASSKRWMAFWTFMCLICLLAGGAGGILLYAGHMLQPTEPGPEVRFTIPRGVSSGRIANLLEQNGIIRDGTIFAYYLKYKKQGDQFQAGEYAMTPGMELSRVVEMLNHGETVPPEMIKFTVTEGLTVEQIAGLLEEKGYARREALLELAAHPDKLTPPQGTVLPAFVKSIPDNKHIKYRLEGYLFPDTYEMLATAGEQDIVFRLLLETANKLKALPDGWEDVLEERGMSFHELLTVASLIEREAALDEERPKIASVIYNRLNKKMKLDIDATVQYALPEHKDRLLTEDTKVDHPFNTYLYAGLPPGPIASPGIASLRAALFPEQTKFYYYVTKKDGTKGHLFAETLAQHQKNINASNKSATTKQ